MTLSNKSISDHVVQLKEDDKIQLIKIIVQYNTIRIMIFDLQ